MEKIEIEGEKIYLKKNNFGWKVVYPMRNEDNSINWKHLIAGRTWWNLVIVGLIVMILIGVVNEYSNNIELANQCFEELKRYRP
jgi:hypothetical protein